MAHSGSRHQLVLYTQILNRWWHITLGIGIVMLLLAYGPGHLPGFASAGDHLNVTNSSLWAVGSAGSVAVLLSIFLLAVRRSAYVQPCDDHLRLVTPFFRLRISYRRIRKSSSMKLGSLFLHKNFKQNRGLLQPWAESTAIVLEMNGLPLSRGTLRLFLSPLFFPDKTPRMVFLVPDWIKFSTELESFRSRWMESQRKAEKDPRLALLSRINKL